MSTLRFDEQNHEYWLGDRRLSSVTEILGALGIINPEWFTWKARMRGKAAHIGAQLVEQGGVDWESVKATEEALQTPVEPYIRGWERFLKETGWRSVKIEQPNHHGIYQYAGTPDRVGFFSDGQEGLLDIKTGSPEDWWSLQVGGYSEMEPRLTDRGTRRLVDVCLTEKGDFDLVPCRDVNAGRLFLSMNATYQWGRAHGAYRGKPSTAVPGPAGPRV